MSPRSRKYKKVEAFFSKVRPAAPDSPLETASNPPEPGAPAEVLMARVEETQTPLSAEDTRPEPAVPPAASSPADGRPDFMNDIGRGQKTGFLHDREEAAALEAPLPPPSENTLCVPLIVSGTTIGIIQGDGNETDWTAQEIEIVSAVAAQLARHLKNLRLLEQREKRAGE